MSFFFKKDKKGASSASSQGGTPEKQKSTPLSTPVSTTVSTQQPPNANASSANQSVNSLPSGEQPRSRQSEDPQGVRVSIALLQFNSADIFSTVRDQELHQANPHHLQLHRMPTCILGRKDNLYFQGIKAPHFRDMAQLLMQLLRKRVRYI